MNNDTIGAQLRQQRQAQKRTLTEVGQRLYMNPDYISEIERGLHLPNLRTLETIAGELGLRVMLVKQEER